MINSGIWSDRNKAGMLLMYAAQAREARWHMAGYAMPARLMLGRMAGIEEQRNWKMINSGQAEEIVQAAVKGKTAAEAPSK